MFNIFKNAFGAGATVIEADLGLREARYIVLDTELTGLDSRTDKIVSIGAVKMEGGRIAAGETLSLLVDPKREMSRESVRIHGITPSDVAGMPGIEEAIRELAEFCGDDVIVGWCVGLDMGFIDREMKKVVGRRMSNPAVDLRAAHDWLMGRRPSYRGICGADSASTLHGVAKSLGVSVNDAHDALIDAYITAQVFQRQMPVLERADVRTLSGLLKISEKGGESTEYGF